MASTYTGLGVQLMVTGEKAGTWGTLTNTNWNIIEQISGGYTTRHYGRPSDGVHAVQIEINRALYMDETTITRAPNMALLKEHISQVIGALAELGRLDLAAE